MKTTKFFFSLTFLVGIFFIPGCTGSRQSPPAVNSERLEKQVQDKIQEIRHERALEHFIQGTALDANGSYAEAVLEYQEALDAEPNAAISYAISKDYLLLGKLPRAAEAAQDAVAREPKNISYREHLGSIYFQAARLELAVHEYEEIVKIDSTYTAGWFALARLYQPTQPQKTLEIFENLLRKTPEQMEILFQCAQLYASLGRYDEAAAKYKRMLELDPGSTMLQKQLAEMYIQGRRMEQAETLLESLIAADSSDAESILTLADVALDQKKIQKSVSLYEQLLKSNLKNPETRLQAAAGFFKLTAHDSTFIPKSKSLFHTLLKENPADWRPYWYLGAIALQQHDDSLAAEYFHSVIEREERHGDAWWFFGSSLFEQGKYELLLQNMDHAQRILPNDFRFYLLQGLALTRMEKNEEAVEPLEKAYSLNSKDLNTLSTLALTLDGLHRFTRSDSLYEQGLQQNPESALLLNNYGYSLAERGLQLQRALDMSKRAVAAEPENAAYLDTYGWIFFKLGKFEDAAAYIEKSVATGRASSVVHEHLGDSYNELGKKEKARECWKKAFELDPKNISVQEKINRGK